MLLALLIVLPSCVGPQPPHPAVAAPWGTARAASVSKAQEVALALQPLAPGVCHELGVPAPPLVEIWRVDSGSDNAIDARTLGDRIELGPECAVDDAWLVAQEFAH